MIRKVHSGSKGIFRFAGVLAGLALLVAFALFLNALFASRTLQPIKTQSLNSQALFPMPTKDSNQADSTTGWKDYTDTVQGYTLKYPPNWYEFAKEETYNTPPTHYFQGANPAKVEETLNDRSYIAVIVWKDSESFQSTHRKQDLHTYFQQLQARPLEDLSHASTEAKVENLVIDGLSAVKIITQTPDGVPSEPVYNVHIYVLKKSLLYEIVAHGAGRGDEERINPIFTLLSNTFRFLQ